MVETQSDGTFVLDGVEPGTYVVTVEKEDFKTITIDDVEVKQGETVDLGELTLKSKGTIKGRIMDIYGRPVPVAEVTILPK